MSPAHLLPAIAKALGMSIDALYGHSQPKRKLAKQEGDSRRPGFAGSLLLAAFTSTTAHAAMAITSGERDFFIALGERICLLRKSHGITQAQLAETLGVSQQTVQAYEVGRRRIQVAALPVVARTLSVSLEELFGEGKQAARGKRGPAPR